MKLNWDQGQLLWTMVVKSGSRLIKSGYVWFIGAKLVKAVNFCVCCLVKVNLCLNVKIGREQMEFHPTNMWFVICSK